VTFVIAANLTGILDISLQDSKNQKNCTLNFFPILSSEYFMTPLGLKFNPISEGKFVLAEYHPFEITIKS
jgi:hypothetical protein